MKNKLKVWSLLTWLLVSTQSYAANEYGYVENVIIAHPNNDTTILHFEISGSKVNGPSCNSNSAVPERWSIRMDGPDKAAAKAMYAMLMSAKRDGLPVVVEGHGDCRYWDHGEAPWYIALP